MCTLCMHVTNACSGVQQDLVEHHGIQCVQFHVFCVTCLLVEVRNVAYCPHGVHSAAHSVIPDCRVLSTTDLRGRAVYCLLLSSSCLQDLDSLPRGLMVLPELQQVREWYITSFKELRTFSFSKPSAKPADIPPFHQLLRAIFHRHIKVLW